MKKIFLKHPDIILSVLALVLVSIVIGLFTWGMGDIAMNVDRALNFKLPAKTTGFDIQGAAGLDLHGQ